MDCASQFIAYCGAGHLTHACDCLIEYDAIIHAYPHLLTRGYIAAARGGHHHVVRGIHKFTNRPFPNDYQIIVAACVGDDLETLTYVMNAQNESYTRGIYDTIIAHDAIRILTAVRKPCDLDIQEARDAYVHGSIKIIRYLYSIGLIKWDYHLPNCNHRDFAAFVLECCPNYQHIFTPTKLCNAGHVELLNALLKCGVELDPNDYKQFMADACRSGRLEMVEFVHQQIGHLPNPNLYLIETCMNGRRDILSYLLKHIHDPNLAYQTYIEHAVEHGHARIAAQILAAHPKCVVDWSTCFVRACALIHIDDMYYIARNIPNLIIPDRVCDYMRADFVDLAVILATRRVHMMHIQRYHVHAIMNHGLTMHRNDCRAEVYRTYTHLQYKQLSLRVELTYWLPAVLAHIIVDYVGHV
jgi:hypothetical protein